MPEIKAIIHDWDDTVATGFDHYKNFYFDLAIHFGLVAPLVENLKSSWGQTIHRIAHDQWSHLSFIEVEAMVNEYLPIRKDLGEPQLFEGVPETIRQLSGQYALAVLSSGNMEQIMQTYRTQLSVDVMYHDIIVAPPQYVVHKAETTVLDPVISVLRRRGIKNEEMVMVGDHPYDRLAADTQGLLFVAVTTGITEREEFLSTGTKSENILSSFAQLPIFLRLLNQ